MNSLCGMSRNEQRLTAAIDIIFALKKHIHNFYWTYKLDKDFLEVRNIADTASVILRSALARKETRACHCREDFPKLGNAFQKITIVEKDKEVYFQK